MRQEGFLFLFVASQIFLFHSVQLSFGVLSLTRAEQCTHINSPLTGLRLADTLPNNRTLSEIAKALRSSPQELGLSEFFRAVPHRPTRHIARLPATGVWCQMSTERSCWGICSICCGFVDTAALYIELFVISSRCEAVSILSSASYSCLLIALRLMSLLMLWHETIIICCC